MGGRSPISLESAGMALAKVWAAATLALAVHSGFQLIELEASGGSVQGRVQGGSV